MAKTWLSISVELLGGRDVEPWPWPGRIFAVGPSHSFDDLADAINTAFARWDRSHLSVFTLSDGRVVADDETADDFAASEFGPLTSTLDSETAKVARTVKPGDEFRFVFDLGDEWTHLCTVHAAKIDPMETLGIRPRGPLPYWGWGNIPDQYGRRWAEDPGEGPVPPVPRRPHPIMMHDWPSVEDIPTLDMRTLRATIVAQDADLFRSTIAGCDVDDALQIVGSGVPIALDKHGEDASMMALSIVNRLMMRSWPGDDVLRENLLARLRDEQPPGRLLPVDLDVLSMVREGGAELASGGYLDLKTGDVHSEESLDASVVGVDAAIDVAAEPERWLPIEHSGPHEAWNDMAAFAKKQRDAHLSEQLKRSLEGKGAFRRFRDAIHDAGLHHSWIIYSDDRQLGRSRAFLADHGISVA
ncbi:UPF0158 family protein [Paramicrobacterium fandaimingii]|uniref:UPF0158 family protein n=1 Tax=Paramicrobacterium fandaimingii TaxID=2708079 RepID=UPI0014227082|nr:UPF0158 family protein [Microbacterium fandaimingii]